MGRGLFGFDVTKAGDLVDCAKNVQRLQDLWLDRYLIEGAELGEGDPGDFDHGAWHIACHLVAAAGVRQTRDGRLLWLEISHHGPTDEYIATVSLETPEGLQTWPVASADGRELLSNSAVLGFVEGNSLGRTSARGCCDPPTLFNLWRRQDFDQPLDSSEDGGRVWEHWCTTRDLRKSSRLGTSVLTAFVSLVAALGDLFPAVVARGRVDYAHPKQLCALVEAGFVSEASAGSPITPTPLPVLAERFLLESTPAKAIAAAKTLEWDPTPRYYMFPRRIDKWCQQCTFQDELGRMRAERCR